MIALTGGSFIFCLCSLACFSSNVLSNWSALYFCLFVFSMTVKWHHHRHNGQTKNLGRKLYHSFSCTPKLNSKAISINSPSQGSAIKYQSLHFPALYYTGSRQSSLSWESAWTSSMLSWLPFFMSSSMLQSAAKTTCLMQWSVPCHSPLLSYNEFLLHLG